MLEDAGLRAALDAALTGVKAARLAPVVERLVAAYRSGDVPAAPLVASETDALAYAGYRMPATHAAVATALAQVRAAVPAWSPGSVVDVGAGTGAASWAVSAAFPDAQLTLLEQSASARSLGQRLGLEGDWRDWTMGRAVDLPDSDLVVAAYVLGELSPELRRRFVAAAAQARAVLVVEPGTPAGHQRVIAARTQLIEAGFTIVAPCPHDLACPLAERDWCHFSVRVRRSALHRRLKEGQLDWEDEKFSFVCAVRDVVPLRPAGRVLRHPQIRKGLVRLELCRPDGAAADRNVGKSEGATYKRARDTDWGDAWA